MKRFISLAVIAGISLLLAGAGLRAGVKAQPQILTGILNKMEKANQELKSLKAEIVLEKTNTQIDVTETTYGQLIYKPGTKKSKQKMRIGYTKPSQDILVVDGDNYVFYQPRIKQAIKGLASRIAKGKQDGLAQIINTVLSGSIRSESDKYSITPVKDEMVNGYMTSVLRLTPKTKDQFTSIDVWVNQQNWIPVQIHATERNGDLTKIMLKNQQLNADVPNNVFSLDLPKGTAIVDKP